MVIDTLGEALSAFQHGARALKAENAALRAENDRLRRHRRWASRPDSRVDGAEPAEVAIPIGVQAPRVARSVVAEWLADHVAPSELESSSPNWSLTASATVACRKAKTSWCAFTSGATASSWRSSIPARAQ